MVPQPLNQTVRLSDVIAPAFLVVHQFIKRHQYSTYLLKGGRGSTKSSFVAIEIILGIMADPEANAMCIRKVGATLRDSVLATLLWATEVLKVSHLFVSGVAPMRLIYQPTGQVILLKGLDDPKKLKSIKLTRGYFKYLWFEEADECDGMDEIRSVEQSVMRGGSTFVEFITYNPPNDPHAWVNKEADIEKPGRLVHTSDYRTVPKSWLGPKFIEEAEHLKKIDPLKYDHVYLGKAVGNAEAIIFSGRFTIEDFVPEPGWDGPYQGADWGFANDPNTLLRMWIAPPREGGLRKRLMIEHEAFGVGIDLDDIPAFYSKIPDAKKYKIRADCSRPETISHVKNMGFDIVGAEKWQGSIEDGIEVIKSFDIVIHTRCTHMQEEARMYSYKVDKNTKDVMPIIVDKYNHGWDAVRYGLAPFIKRKKAGFFDIKNDPK